LLDGDFSGEQGQQLAQANDEFPESREWFDEFDTPAVSVIALWALQTTTIPNRIVMSKLIAAICLILKYMLKAYKC
jgi:hypothetical protein